MTEGRFTFNGVTAFFFLFEQYMIDQRLSNFLSSEDAERKRKGEEFFASLNREVDQMRSDRLAKEGKKEVTFDFHENRLYHCWLSRRHGFALTVTKKPPNKTYKYLGTSSGTKWPKKMSTGRVFYAQVNIPNYKIKKAKKESLANNSKQLTRDKNRDRTT